MSDAQILQQQKHMIKEIDEVKGDFKEHEKANKKTFDRLFDLLLDIKDSVAHNGEVVAPYIAAVNSTAEAIKNHAKIQVDIITQVASLRERFDMTCDDLEEVSLPVLAVNVKENKDAIRIHGERLEKIEQRGGKIALKILSHIGTAGISFLFAWVLWKMKGGSL